MFKIKLNVSRSDSVLVKIGFVLLFAAVFLFLGAAIFMLLWDKVVPAVFNGPGISYWTSFCMLLLIAFIGQLFNSDSGS
jgi:ABC-type bacteriocin/lantibiotic exporter with double-glycine peptidase domain